MQEENFEEDEGIYEELNLDEEEEKFGLVVDDDDSEDSDDASAGLCGFCSALDFNPKLKFRYALTFFEEA